MRAWRTAGIVLLAILTAAVMALVAGTVSGRLQTDRAAGRPPAVLRRAEPPAGPPGHRHPHRAARGHRAGRHRTADALRLGAARRHARGIRRDAVHPRLPRPARGTTGGRVGARHARDGRRLRPVTLDEPAAGHRQLARPDDAARLGRGRRRTTSGSGRRDPTSTSSRSRRCATSSTPCARPGTLRRRRPAPATRRGATARAGTRRCGPGTSARSTRPSWTCWVSRPPHRRSTSPRSWGRSGTTSSAG